MTEGPLLGIMIRPAHAVAAAALFLLPAAARADPCAGPLPNVVGRTFSGPVRYVGDGDSLCVGQSPNPRSWIEVRLADFDAPELHDLGGQRAKALLQRVTRGRQLVCRATPGRSGRIVVYDRVIATCTLGGRRLGDVLRAAGGAEGGR